MSRRAARAGNHVKRCTDMKGCILFNFFVTMFHQSGTPATRDYCMTRPVPTRFLSPRLSNLLAISAVILGAEFIHAEAIAAEKVNTGWLMAVSGATISAPQFPGSETYSFISLPPAKLCRNAIMHVPLADTTPRDWALAPPRSHPVLISAGDLNRVSSPNSGRNRMRFAFVANSGWELTARPAWSEALVQTSCSKSVAWFSPQAPG